MKIKKWIVYYEIFKNEKKVIKTYHTNGFSEGEAKVNFSCKYPKGEIFCVIEDKYPYKRIK